MENSTRRVSIPLKGCGFAAEDFIKPLINIGDGTLTTLRGK
jgi:hypothetical protein